jgi:hypothetical protein
LRGKIIAPAADSTAHGHNTPSVSITDIKGGGGGGAETQFDMTASFMSKLEQMNQAHREEGSCYSEAQKGCKEKVKLNRYHILQGCYCWGAGSGKKRKKKKRKKKKKKAMAVIQTKIPTADE